MMPGHSGSALILTVVLTSLLAMVGVLFLMVARIDKMATSATTEHRQLTFAVDTVVALVGEELAADVPDAPNDVEYYDYPDANDPWLAPLEPYGSGSDYYWRQISNIAGTLTGDTRDVPVQVVGEREKIAEVNEIGETAPADADGDGVSDAVWFEVPGVSSTKGGPIYAAVRIVDHGGMLNVNTGFKFTTDPNERQGVGIRGDSQLQINVVSLAAPSNELPTSSDARALLYARGATPDDLLDSAWPGYRGRYVAEVIWRYPEQGPTQVETPFDLSDELELRYRYLLNHTGIDTRLENWGRFRQSMFSTPRSDPCEVPQWFGRAAGRNDPNGYAYRPIATTYNMDRIITPQPFSVDGGPGRRKMVNVNRDSIQRLRAALQLALRGHPRADAMAAQIAVNLADYIDDDSEVSYLDAGSGYGTVYGFERPCVYISEFAYNRVVDSDGEHESYGIELYKPFAEDMDPSDEWRLVVAGNIVPLSWPSGQQFHVLIHEDPAAPLATGSVTPQEDDAIEFAEDDRISLQRPSPRGNEFLIVDEKVVPAGWMQDVDADPTSIERDITPHHCIVRAWADTGQTRDSTLGTANSYRDPLDPLTRTIQAHPRDEALTNIGEIGMVLAKGAYCTDSQDPSDPALELAGYTATTAAEILIDLSNPIYADAFNYLTVMDPVEYGAPAGETRVQGRININTAPAFVLAQLPWLQYSMDGPVDRAGSIVAERDQEGAFESIAGLMGVLQMHDLAYDGENNLFEDPNRGPDLTTDDVSEDYEERDLLFTRVSNLVSVRSDVFTAYILVRVGADGPQQRVVAILDRSLVLSPADRPRLLALYQVPDPR
jgi:hypothetical protein